MDLSSRNVSDHEGQFGERVGETSRRSDIGPEVVEAPAKVLDEGVPADDHPRSSITLQPSHRSEARLETPVVGLERIVRVDLRVVEGVLGCGVHLLGYACDQRVLARANGRWAGRPV